MMGCASGNLPSKSIILSVGWAIIPPKFYTPYGSFIFPMMSDTDIMTASKSSAGFLDGCF